MRINKKIENKIGGIKATQWGIEKYGVISYCNIVIL